MSKNFFISVLLLVADRNESNACELTMLAQKIMFDTTLNKPITLDQFEKGYYCKNEISLLKDIFDNSIELNLTIVKQNNNSVSFNPQMN